MIIRQCRDCRTARLRSLRSENHLISRFPEEFKFRQRWNRTRGLLPVLPVPNFISAEVPTKSYTLKQLPTFGLGLGVTVREKRSYLKFPSTSGFGEVLPRILGDPTITWHPQILSRKNFFFIPGQNLVINFGLAINTKTRVNIRCTSNSHGKISEFRGLASINIQTQIPKFSLFEIC